MWFVPLADVDDAAHLPDRILDVLKPRKHGQIEPLEEILDVLGDEPALLILDNFEHIVEECAPFVARLLEASPGIACLVTSRQGLKVSGEREFHLDPLPVPGLVEPNDYDTEEQLGRLAEYPSVQLFVDRCQALRPDVQLTLNNARHFATICAKLEGIPLAIEIAAGLSNSFTPAQMVKHLESRLDALTSRRRDTVSRHRSLRAAIDYSYVFLSPRLQRFFAALSVFRGGFTIESAHDVCYLWFSKDPVSKQSKRNPHQACLSLVLDLQERSLLRSEDLIEGSDLRFRLLETFREYGEECLTEAEYEDLRERHAAHYLASSLPPNGANDAESRAQLHLKVEADYDNYLAALDFLLQKRQIERCIKLLAALSTLWDVRGTKVVERNYIRHIAGLAEFRQVAPAARVQLLRMLGTTHLRNSEFLAAFQACSNALDVAMPTGDHELIAVCYFGMSLCAGFLGRVEECLQLGRKVLEHAPKTNGMLLERTWVSIGSAHWSREELTEAEEAFNQAHGISQAFRSGEPDALILAHLAGVYLDQGRFDDAMATASEGIRISRRTRNEISLSSCLAMVARYHRLKGNLAAAVASNHEALVKGRDVAIAIYCMEILRGHALILADMGEDEAATALIAATQGLATMEKQLDRRESQGALDAIRGRLAPGVYERAWAHGLALDLDEAFRLALGFK